MSHRVTGGLMLTFLLLLTAGCDGSDSNQVTVDYTDSSAPSVSLDAYNLPVQQGASSQPQPETIDSTCCDITRTAGGVEISLAAGAIDDQSGVKNISLFVEATGTCVDRNGISSGGNPGLIGGPAAQAQDARDHPSTANRNLAVTFGLNRTDLRNCASDERVVGRARVWAEAENFAGGKNRTKTLTVTFP